MDRRRFLQAGLTLTALAAVPAHARANGKSTEPPEAFQAFLDTLLPADAFGPSASDLGIITPAWTGLTTFGSDRAFMMNALQWLNHQAGGRFADLPPEQRHRLISWMAERPAGEAPSLFYSRVRDRAVMLYYRHPDIQARLGIPHPPQPLGYIDDFTGYTARNGN